jgi:hypothetical protein
MLSRRELVGRLTAGAAVTVAWASGAARASIPRVEKIAPEIPGAGDAGLALATEALEASPPALAQRLDGGPSAAITSPPWELLRPLALGAVVAHGWRVAELSTVEDGACVLTLRNGRGRAHRVHLCRNDGHPQGLVYTEKVDLVVMNGGQGDLPTEEGLAQAVADVAHVLAANEGRRRHGGVITALLPQAERLRRFAGSGSGRLR